MRKLILIDGNALVHRAFHALPALTSAKGVVTNAVFGFTSILLRTIKELKPDYIAATFDLAGPTFRHEEFAEYKIHREKAPQELYNQIPLVKEILAAFGIPVYEKESYEADDLIGTLATRAKKEENLQTIITTGDLDTLQLVDHKKVVVYTLRKGVTDTVIYDEEAVGKRYGLKPGQLNDYRGLKGDPSDNIPGVPGVGEKTAAQLIQEFGSLEKMYKKLEEKKAELKISDKLKEKLLEHKNQAFFSKQLSEIVTDLDIDFSLTKADWRRNLNLAKVETAFKDLGFFSLLKRLPEIGLSVQAGLDLPAPTRDATVEMKLESKPEEKNIFFIENGGTELTADILANPDCMIVGHDLKNVIKPFIAHGLEIKNRLFDTKIAAYLLYPDLSDYDFHKIYYAEFRESADDPSRKSAYLWKLKEHLTEKLESFRLTEVFENIEIPLIKVLAEMELNGIKVDTEILAKMLNLVNKGLDKLEKNIYKLAGTDFNINSPQQLGEILFQRLEIKGRVRKTGGGALSTAAPELEKLREEHPIIDLILQYRELQKLKTTYIEPFPSFVREDGRIHTTYNQTGAATGRLSSENPNLQNIPIKTELGQQFRSAFIAEEDHQLVSFDYSQLELRIVAHVAKDEKMIAAFQRGEDIHTRTAVEIFGVAQELVTKEMRRTVKALNFGIIYGMGSVGFARAAGVDRAQAKDFIDRYFGEFSGVARYMAEIKNKAHKNGYVETIFGRRRLLLDIYSTMPQIAAAAERAAINHPIQGTAADIVKLAMSKVHQFIHTEFKGNDVRMLLQVHDEVVFEIRENLAKKVCPRIKVIMEDIVDLKVPLITTIKVGKNWAEMQSL